MNEIRIKKLYLFLVCFVIVTIAILFRLFNLTVKDRKPLSSLDGLDKPRGIIYDSKMHPLTINIPAYTIYLDTESVALDGNEDTDINEAYTKIFSIIGITKEKFTDLLSTKRRTIRLAQNINLESYKKIKEIKDKYTVRSIYGIESYKRFYPYEDVFAHVIGYMNKTETEGYAGLEATYEAILSSENDNPKDIVLTLDRDVQTIVRNEVLKTVAEKSPQSVTVIVSDVNTGAIIANYSYPSFDPNNPFVYVNNERMDRSIMSTIYPGSTMKIFAELAAIEQGVVNSDEVFHCKGYYDYSRQTRIHCDYPHGDVAFNDILKYSCNYAIVTIAERIDKQFFYDYLKRFGFGEPTGVGPYKNEWSGIYHQLNKWHRFSRGYLAIGYDLSVTPMQIAASYLPLLNGGWKVPMHVVDSLYDGIEKISITNRLKKTRIIDEQYSQIARVLLRKGVESGSTGHRANLLNIDVVGKTGTAITEVYRGNDSEKPEKYYQSIFVGGFPLEDPKISILVLLDDPLGSGSRAAGRVAAPLFAKIANQIIPYLGLVDGEIYSINTNDFLSLVPPPSNTTNNIMPNITGLSLRDALNNISYIVSNNNAKIAIQGEGYVSEFSPQAGTSITNNSVIRLLLKAPLSE
ncbi:penicillin-binding protein [Brachyspira pulli]|uniref:penicillin-binding protein n=1 Tax=Brachyspira pulli TaxID=310721 RepID=UPI0030051EDD